VTARDDAGMQSELVRYERDGHVATITHHRPDKPNAVDGAMRAQLNAAFTRSTRTRRYGSAS
jgi:enoyl-CoA hydratase/carnithine racemase